MDNLEPATRTFLASAEAVFRARRDDRGFDFSGPAVEYAKAVEVELNALIFPPLRKLLHKAQPKDREVRVDGRVIDLGGEKPHQTLGAMKVLLERDEIVKKNVQSAYQNDHQLLLGMLPHQLVLLAELRNPAAHSSVSAQQHVSMLRDDVLGIGKEGLVAQLVRSKLRAVGGAS